MHSTCDIKGNICDKARGTRINRAIILAVASRARDTIGDRLHILCLKMGVKISYLETDMVSFLIEDNLE